MQLYIQGMDLCRNNIKQIEMYNTLTTEETQSKIHVKSSVFILFLSRNTSLQACYYISIVGEDRGIQVSIIAFECVAEGPDQTYIERWS